MGMLDSDAEIIRKSEGNKKRKKRRVGELGLTRFKTIGTPLEQASPKLPENRRENEKVTNRVQSGDKAGSNPSTNRVQTKSKRGQNRVQTGDKVVTNRVTNRVQPKAVKNISNEEKIETPSEAKLSLVVGCQRELLMYFFVLSRQTGSREIGPIALANISKTLGKNNENIKTQVRRLCKKGYLIRHKGKTGRGGFLNFEIPENIYQQFLMEESAGNHLKQIREERLVTKQVTEPGTSLSSSSNLDTKEKTTTNSSQSQGEEWSRGLKPLPEEWEAIDISALESIGFRTAHVKQIFSSGKSDLETVKESIEAMSHDIRHSKIPAYLNSPLGLIMKNLRVKGEGYNSFDENFETCEERAEREMAEIAKKRREKREAFKKEIFESKFLDWKESLSEEKKLELKPPVTQNTHGPIFEASLRSYFENNEFGKNLNSGEMRESVEVNSIGALIDKSLKENTGSQL